MTSRRLFLIRHGRTPWNLEGRYVSRTELDLDDIGHAQAEWLGGWAESVSIDAVVTSPTVRTVTTANMVAMRLRLELTVDERLRELDFGAAEGHTVAELRARDPSTVDRFFADPARHHFPGGEAPADAVERMDAAVADIMATSASRVVVVTHSTILRLYLCHVLGMALGNYRRAFPSIEHCAGAELSFDGGSFGLRGLNAAIPRAMSAIGSAGGQRAGIECRGTDG